MRTDSAQRGVDREVARLAARQYGVISLDQLRRLGLTASAVRERVASGRLHPVHQSVYAVGHPVVAPNGRLLAAVLACGKGAFLSHWSAAYHWGILPSSRSTVDVSSPTRTGRGREGIAIHRCGGVIESDIAVVAGIPCSTVARTLLDLAAVMRRDALERACEQAEILRLFDLRAVLDVLERAGRRRGAGRLRRLLSQPFSDVSGARSELERRFLDLCRRTRLPAPAVNVWVPEAALEADFVWPEPRLVVEVNGYRFHRTRQAFERDHDRDQRLTLAGYHVLRFGWSQVIGRPRAVAASIQTALDRPSRLPP